MEKSGINVDLSSVFIFYMDVHIRTDKTNDIPLILGLLYELGRPKPENKSELKVFRN